MDCMYCKGYGRNDKGRIVLYFRGVANRFFMHSEMEPVTQPTGATSSPDAAAIEQYRCRLSAEPGPGETEEQAQSVTFEIKTETASEAQQAYLAMVAANSQAK